jgi:hypothetical protein
VTAIAADFLVVEVDAFVSLGDAGNETHGTRNYFSCAWVEGKSSQAGRSVSHSD